MWYGVQHAMFDELGDGVFRRRYEALDLNIGVVLGEDGVLIVDTRAPHPQADELRLSPRLGLPGIRSSAQSGDLFRRQSALLTGRGDATGRSLRWRGP
jgi:hypothetical protein